MAAVILENVHVDFPIYGAQRSLRNAIFQRATGGTIRREGRRHGRVVVRALSNLSLTLQEGDRLGLVGHNGSGKSTLLKVIAGIYEPVQGRLRVDGRVTPLFDAMPGLDVEDTGYENIFTAGLLLGMTRETVERMIPEIEEFCELGEYLSLPVRTYSAGMMTRLGFALVTALNPDILLMDEGFGAADLRFTDRAAERMDEFIGRSRILMLASHSDTMIRSICNKAAILDQGELMAIGPVDEILTQYNEHVHEQLSKSSAKPSVYPVSRPPMPAMYSEMSIRDVGLPDRLSRSDGSVRFTRFLTRDVGGETRWKFEPGETLVFRAEYEVLREIPDLAFYLRLSTRSSEEASLEHVLTDMYEVLSKGPLQLGHRAAIELTLPDQKLMPHRLFFYVYMGRVDYSRCYDVIDSNVALPHLDIVSRRPGKRLLHGSVALDYRVDHWEVSAALEHVLEQGR